MYHHVENPVLEQFSSPLTGVESWSILDAQDFPYNYLYAEEKPRIWPEIMNESNHMEQNTKVGSSVEDNCLYADEIPDIWSRNTSEISQAEQNAKVESSVEDVDCNEQGIEKFSYQIQNELKQTEFSSKPTSVEGTPSKMMSDHSLIISDSHMDHSSFIMKNQGIEEVVLDPSQVPQFIFHDAVVNPNELIVEQNVEVGNDEAHAEIILVPNTMIKQEDIIEGGEVIVGSNVDNEVIIDDHLDTDHFVIGSSIDIGSDQIDDAGFDDSKLIIDTDQYGLEEEPPSIAYDCGECGVIFKSRAAMKKHLKSHHTKLQKNKSKKTSSKEKYSSNKRYNCPSCSYSSQRRDKLDKHMEKHVLLDGVHPCGKRRHKPEALPQRHRHNAEEYRCPYCPYSCTVYRALKKHQKVHASGNETFTLKLSCKICGKDRPTESEMQRHMKKHKNDEHFLCDLCSFSSVQLKKIIQHRRMHTGEKPHLCPHCSYRSARRDNLRSHVRRMHKRQNMYIDTFNPNEESTACLTY